MRTPPPTSEDELLERAKALAGLTIAHVAESYEIDLPANTLRAKGWIGVLMEAALGATAASKPEPDFQLIGVEMKTLPVDAQGKPRESTYVCTVPLINRGAIEWETSNVRTKLNRVLWVPIESDQTIEFSDRRIGTPLIWSPSLREDAELCADWKELMDMVCLGELEQITAHHGTWLQIRPKAANSHSRRLGIDDTGAPAPTMPRGFYLRTGFTHRILRENYLVLRS